MRRESSVLILLSVAAAAQTRADDPWGREKLVLTQAGISVSDQAALISTLRDKPRLAEYAAHFLGRLPKSDLAIRELNAAVLSENEWLSLYSMESLMGWDVRQWVGAARSRLPKYKNEAVRLSVAGLLARAGVFDGWGMVESTIMGGDGRYRNIALLQVPAFRDMKELSGQPFDLVKKLDSMRSNSSNKAVRDRLLEKITQLTRQPPAQNVPRK